MILGRGSSLVPCRCSLHGLPDAEALSLVTKVEDVHFHCTFTQSPPQRSRSDRLAAALGSRSYSRTGHCFRPRRHFLSSWSLSWELADPGARLPGCGSSFSHSLNLPQNSLWRLHMLIFAKVLELCSFHGKHDINLFGKAMFLCLDCGSGYMTFDETHQNCAFKKD